MAKKASTNAASSHVEEVDEGEGVNRTDSNLTGKMKYYIDREQDKISSLQDRVRGRVRNIFNAVSGQATNHETVAQSLIGRSVPDFEAPTVFGQDIKQIKLSDQLGKYVVLFFYPLDFTFVCPTELHAFQERLAEFQSRGVEILACSVDSQFTHQAWLRTPKRDGGIEGIEYGLVSDVGGHIAHDFGVLNPDGVAFRGLFLIDRKGVVRHQTVNDLPLGRNVDEVIRMVDALQHSEKHGEVCPANWHKGESAIKPNKESVSEFLAMK